MLLQTLVQLNILLLAAPALAGWGLLPTAQPLLSQTAGIVFQYINAEAAPSAAVEEKIAKTNQAKPQQCVFQRKPQVVPERASSLSPAFTAPVEVFVPGLHPFPHATRAP